MKDEKPKVQTKRKHRPISPIVIPHEDEESE